MNKILLPTLLIFSLPFTSLASTFECIIPSDACYEVGCTDTNAFGSCKKGSKVRVMKCGYKHTILVASDQDTIFITPSDFIKTPSCRSIRL